MVSYSFTVISLVLIIDIKRFLNYSSVDTNGTILLKVCSSVVEFKKR